jgi:isopentenyl phosphate kinase
MKKLIFIKLGGSLITKKDVPYTARYDIIQQFAKELKEIISKRQDVQFVLGNGAGSFGHYPVIKHNLKNGIQTSDQVQGFCEVRCKSS